MKSKNIKIVDQNNIDRDASIMFAFELEGSEYVTYWIERDDDENNLFVSKVLKNTDGTSNLLDIENEEEKTRISEIVKVLITRAVKDENDKLVGETITLDSGKVVKLIVVSFNKEQKINVPKTYITTVKKEVTKVSGEYFDVVPVETPKVVEEIFPSVTPVVTESKENPAMIFPEVSNESSVEPTIPVVNIPAAPVVEPAVVESITSAVPVAETPVAKLEVPIVEAVTAMPELETIPVVNTPTVPEVEVPAVVQQSVEVQTPVVEEVNSAPAVSISEVPVVEAPKAVEPSPVVPTPIVSAPEVSQPVVEAAPVDNNTLVFNASKETNLNAALGEVAKDTTIPVENIESVREFGEEVPMVNTAPASSVASVTQPETPAELPTSTGKSGFANSKFFMVIAIAFFLASCVFLGYEVFNYFQITK